MLVETAKEIAIESAKVAGRAAISWGVLIGAILTVDVIRGKLEDRKERRQANKAAATA